MLSAPPLAGLLQWPTGGALLLVPPGNSQAVVLSGDASRLLFRCCSVGIARDIERRAQKFAIGGELQGPLAQGGSFAPCYPTLNSRHGSPFDVRLVALAAWASGGPACSALTRGHPTRIDLSGR